MKTNRAMIYKQAAAVYAHNQVTAPPWGQPTQRLQTGAEVVKYWADLIQFPGGPLSPTGLTALTANFAKAFEAGYQQALRDIKNGVNGEARLPPGTPGDIGA